MKKQLVFWVLVSMVAFVLLLSTCTQKSTGPSGEKIIKIAFVSERDGNEEIYTMNPDGTEHVRLTDNQASDIYPTWSPDGEKIAFCSNRDGNYEIYVMNADGTEEVNLTDNPETDRYPSYTR